MLRTTCTLDNLILQRVICLLIISFLLNLTYKLTIMAKLDRPKDLDLLFGALASKHRREMLYALALQPHSVSQLAAMRKLSLPAIHKHVKLLMDSGLVKSKKIGRTHFLALNRKALLSLQDWLMQYQAYWGSENESFENYADYLSKQPAEGGDNT